MKTAISTIALFFALAFGLPATPPEANFRVALHHVQVLIKQEGFLSDRAGALEDCAVAITDKHNGQYPQNPWGTLTDIRDHIFGVPDTSRKQAAAVCAEREIRRVHK